MNWPGIEPGNSKDLALREKLHRRFQRLLEVIAFNWVDLNLARFPRAQYDEEDEEVHVPILDRNGREQQRLYCLLEILPEEEDGETYLLIELKSERRKMARALAEEAVRSRKLRLQGIWAAKPEHREWLVRGMALSKLESAPSDQQLIRVTEFVGETMMAVEQSGLLELDLGHRDQSED